MKKLILLTSLILALGCKTTRTIQPPQTLPLPPRETPTYVAQEYEVNIPDPPSVQLTLTPSLMPAEARIQSMTIGSTARFKGVLFNAQAWAFIEAQYTGLQDRLTIEHRARMRTLSALAIRDLNRTIASYSAREQECTTIIQGRDREIDRLYHLSQTLNQPIPIGTISVWSLGGFGVGALTVAMIYMFTH